MIVTLKNLHEATPRQVFDQVKTHLLKQKARCIDSEGACRYKRYNNYCAAGCLIGDDRLAKKFDSLEATSWITLVKAGHIPKNPHNILIARLQIIHDGYPVEEWEEMLNEIEKEFRL